MKTHNGAQYGNANNFFTFVANNNIIFSQLAIISTAWLLSLNKEHLFLHRSWSRRI